VCEVRARRAVIHRLTRAEQLFREEAKLPEGARADGGAAAAGMFEELLLFNVADGDAARYLQEYDRLAAWVDSSLDLYKSELSRVLWPVFVQCYLGLVRRNATAEAHALMTRHGGRFRAGRHNEEVQELAAVAVPQHLATSRVSQAAAGARTHLGLTQFSLQLLLSFLHSARLTLALSIINEHIDFEVAEGAPSTAAQEGADAEEEAFASSQREAAPFNASELRLGILQGSVEDRYQTMRAAKAEAAATEVPEKDEDGKLLTKKARAALQRAAELAKAAQGEAANVDRIEPAVPLPPPPDGEAVLAIMAALDARQEVGPDALPSCAFFTFVNTAQSLNCAAFTPDSTHLIGGFADSTVRLYDLRRMGRDSGINGSVPNGTSVKKGGAARNGSAGSDSGSVTLLGHSGPVFGVDASADSQLLFSGSADGTVKVWGAEVGADLATLRGHLFPVWDVAACPGGAYLASASADRTARVWTTERTTALRLLAGHTADVEVVVWHPTCQYVATGSSDRTVRLWDINTGAPVRLFVGLRSTVTALAFSSDGKTLAVGCEDGGVSAWDVAGAGRLGTSQQHCAPVWTLAVSHGDGALLASGGGDNAVKLWSLAGGPGAGGGGVEVPGQQEPVPRLLHSYRTKATPVFHLHWSQRNLLQGTGVLTLPAPGRKQ